MGTVSPYEFRTAPFRLSAVGGASAEVILIEVGELQEVRLFGRAIVVERGDAWWRFRTEFPGGASATSGTGWMMTAPGVPAEHIVGPPSCFRVMEGPAFVTVQLSAKIGPAAEIAGFLNYWQQPRSADRPPYLR